MSQKTKVRIQRADNTKDYYKHLHIQVLGDKFHSVSSSGLEVIGTLTWQGDSQYGWYGMKLSVECDPCESFKLKWMAKISELIRAHGCEEKPEDVLKAISAEEYKYWRGIYMPLSDNGKNVYNVMVNGSVYTSIVALSEKEAIRKANRLKLSREFSIELQHSNLQLDKGDISIELKQVFAELQPL